ncbi:hypothetical protein NQZ68_020865 [Dissostichus eleginoides]|nr:hypothetical protein NQZ68_020865 [Dissostichus eleginoides]
MCAMKAVVRIERQLNTLNKVAVRFTLVMDVPLQSIDGTAWTASCAEWQDLLLALRLPGACRLVALARVGETVVNAAQVQEFGRHWSDLAGTSQAWCGLQWVLLVGLNTPALWVSGGGNVKGIQSTLELYYLLTNGPEWERFRL